MRQRCRLVTLRLAQGDTASSSFDTGPFDKLRGPAQDDKRFGAPLRMTRENYKRQSMCFSSAVSMAIS
jgi:hypothetical protein